MIWQSRVESDLNRPTPKLHFGGTHRTTTPRQTIERVKPLLPDMGVTRVANVTGLDYLGIPVVMVTRPNSRALAVAQGKGIDLDHAKASGIMETIESFHAERISLPLKLHSYHELRRRHDVIDTAQLPTIPNSRFHPHLPILWLEGYDLLGRRPIWVPYESVHVNYAQPLPQGTGCFASNSNGLSSGNRLLEAISAGICEVVERDGDALWMAASDAEVEGRLLDLTTVADETCRGILSQYAAGRMAVEVWETTSDVGIAAYRCHIREADDNPHHRQGMFFGAGCHPSSRIALLRALTEAAQSRLTYISGSRDDIERRDYRRPDETTSTATGSGVPHRRLDAAPTFESDSLNDDLHWELDRLRDLGIQHVVVVDLTQDEIGIPVVKVIIPGLEGIPDGPDYVPGPRARAAAGALG